MNRTAALLACLLALLTSADIQARTWTGVDGKITFEADLLSIEGDSVRLRFESTDAEHLIPTRFLSEADQTFIRQKTTKSPAKSDRKVASVPPTVLASIKREAAQRWPNSYDMQKYVIEQETAAYRYLQRYENARIPAGVLSGIKREAVERWSSSYDMQKYVIEQETAAYLSLHGDG
ncbi:MAG TPA: hypothetical protein VGN57_21895 [Pirellulaceae bacterium]|jgi:hypothetical protein|nr:hypothetical protein [Pirellulaceae bacterium]